MALIKCKECGKEFSDKAPACPNCGCPTESAGSGSEIPEGGVNHGEDKGENLSEKANAPAQKKKIGCLPVIVILVVIGIVASCVSGGSDEKDAEKENAAGSAVVAQQEVGSADSDNEEAESEETAAELVPLDCTSGQEMLSSGGYAYITPADLSTYCTNMPGVGVYLVATISDLDDGSIQCGLGDGYVESTFDMAEGMDKFTASLQEGQTVGLLGTVEGQSDYGFLGSGVKLSNCYVYAVDDEASAYWSDYSDESLQQYFTVTASVAENTEITQDEYIALCQTLDYEDILRNPDSYKDTYATVSGTVDQTIEGIGGLYYTIYLVDGNGNKWSCGYSYADGESQVLEGDAITVYGQCDGTTTATTLLGKQVEMPYVHVEYLIH